MFKSYRYFIRDDDVTHTGRFLTSFKDVTWVRGSVVVGNWSLLICTSCWGGWYWCWGAATPQTLVVMVMCLKMRHRVLIGNCDWVWWWSAVARQA